MKRVWRPAACCGELHKLFQTDEGVTGMAKKVKVIRATNDHINDWLELRLMLWPEPLYSRKDHLKEIKKGLQSKDKVCLLATGGDGQAIGFIEGSIRHNVDGCETSPAGYVEGWYVLKEKRREGVGRTLIEKLEDHFRKSGLKEVAADALWEETEIRNSYVGVGFKEISRIVNYIKEID